MKIPRKKLLGYTWVGWLNLIILQWFFIRLSYEIEFTYEQFENENETKYAATSIKSYRLLCLIFPLTGWISKYRYCLLNKSFIIYEGKK